MTRKEDALIKLADDMLESLSGMENLCDQEFGTNQDRPGQEQRRFKKRLALIKDGFYVEGSKL